MPGALPAPGTEAEQLWDIRVMPLPAPAQECPRTAPARCGWGVVGLSIPGPVWSCVLTRSW